MKIKLIVAVFLFLTGILHAKSGDNLGFYGIINSVKTSYGSVSIEVTGIANLTIVDSTLKNQQQSLSLTLAVIQLKFDSGFKGMHTYSGFRYLDWIDEEKAISLLKEFQEKSAEVRLILDAESLTYSVNDKGLLRPSSLVATLDEVSLWTNLYKESISEYTKDMGVNYELILRPEPPSEPTNKKAEQAGTGQPATRPESKSEGSDQPQPKSEERSR
jgi:hypothetical protein